MAGSFFTEISVVIENNVGGAKKGNYRRGNTRINALLHLFLAIARYRHPIIEEKLLSVQNGMETVLFQNENSRLLGRNFL